MDLQGSSLLSSSSTTTAPFIGLELTGAIGMAIILSTAIFSRSVKRCSTWYTFCASWVLSCISYCLLFFSGDLNSFAPKKAVCVTQAALIHSVPILTACTTLSLLIHGWYNVHFGLSKQPLESHLFPMLVLLCAPFAIWVLFFLGWLIAGMKMFSVAHNFGKYCSFTNQLPEKLSSLMAIIVTFATLPIQASLGLSLCRHFDKSDATSIISVQSLKMVVRVSIFSFLILIGFAEGLVHLLTDTQGPAVDIILAMLPVSGVIIFGVQRTLPGRVTYPGFTGPVSSMDTLDRNPTPEDNYCVKAKLNRGTRKPMKLVMKVLVLETPLSTFTAVVDA